MYSGSFALKGVANSGYTIKYSYGKYVYYVLGL